MKILITGASSALGGHVADSLARHDVLTLDRRPHPRFPTVVCDLREGVPPLPDVDVCLHLAFATDPRFCEQHPDEARRVNVAATAALLARARRFVLASTGYVYGFKAGPLREEMPPEPSDAYARLKVEAEALAMRHPNAAVLRYFFPYGPGTKPASIVNRLFATINAGGDVDVHEEERPRTNPIYISDLVAATRLFCLGELTGAFNVAGLETVSIRELAERIGRHLGKPPRFRPSGKRIGDMIGCTAKMLEVFKPAVGLDAGLRATVDHLRGAADGLVPSPRQPV